MPRTRMKVKQVILYNEEKESALKIKGLCAVFSGCSVEMWQYKDIDTYIEMDNDEHLLLLLIRPELQQQEVLINKINLLKSQIHSSLFLVVISEQMHDRLSLVRYYGKDYTSLFRSVLVIEYPITDQNIADFRKRLMDVIEFVKKCDRQLVPLAGISERLEERLVKTSLQVNFYNGIGELLGVGYTTGINTNGLGARVSCLYIDEMELKGYLSKKISVVFQEKMLGLSSLVGELKKVEESRDAMYDNFIAVSFDPESHLYDGGRTKRIIDSLIEQQSRGLSKRSSMP